MADLSFDQACARLRSTMPDAEIHEVERHGEIDEYGLPTGQKVASVVCYDARLSNSVRKIGGWTFLIDNRFISFAVQKVAMIWLVHRGGTRYGEQKLVKALRHCFKRFYAESLVALGTPPVGRAMLVESILFERSYMDEVLRHSASATNVDASTFNSTTFELARQAIWICQRHEMAHFLLSEPGETLIDNSRKLLDGIMEPAFQHLLDNGNTGLAEEAFCDAFALHSIVRKEDYYESLVPDASLYDAVHLDEVRAASFCYLITMQLGRTWFRALQDARAGWDAAETGAARPEHDRLELDVQAHQRAHLVSSMVDLYIRSRGGDVHSRDPRFYFNPRCDQLIAQAASNLDALAPDDENASVTGPERELARFLASTMWLSTDTSRSLIDAGRTRELGGWARLDTPDEPKPAGRVEDYRNARAEYVAAHAAADRFRMAATTCFAEYTEVFDAIVAEVLSGGIPRAGTTERLETFKTDLCARIESYGRDEEIYAEILASNYSDADRTQTLLKVLEAHLILLTIMRRSLPNGASIAFDVPIRERLLCVEAYAARNRGANVAAFAALVLPELEVSPVAPTKLL